MDIWENRNLMVIWKNRNLEKTTNLEKSESKKMDVWKNRKQEK